VTSLDVTIRGVSEAATIDQGELTIDELAGRTGMTVRNIRAHQSRGLLPPPDVRGRTGYYGPEHEARINLIQELQADGFNLKLIKRLIDSADGLGEEVLRFAHAVRRPFGEERPRRIERRELAERWGTADPELLRRAVEIGVVRELDDRYLEELSPRLARVSEELVALGIPASAALEVGAKLRHHAEEVARGYVELFLEQVWEPFERAGHPEERWPEVREALERMRPLAAESLVAFFGLVMDEAVQSAFGEQLERIRREPPAGS
jgi:DNA-binding transcriptional MerR regulator